MSTQQDNRHTDPRGEDIMTQPTTTTTTMTQSERRSLGALTSRVFHLLGAIEQFHSDPITVAYGVGDMFAAEISEHAIDAAVQEIEAAGYTVDEYVDAVAARTTDKWVYDHGLGMLRDDTPCTGWGRTPEWAG